MTYVTWVVIIPPYMSFIFFHPLVHLQTQANFTFSICQNKVDYWYVSSCCFKLIKHANGTYNLAMIGRSSSMIPEFHFEG